MQVFFMFFAIVCGGIFFSEFETFDTRQAAGFVVGIVVVFVGVYGLAPVNASIANHDDSDTKLGDDVDVAADPDNNSPTVQLALQPLSQPLQ